MFDLDKLQAIIQTGVSADPNFLLAPQEMKIIPKELYAALPERFRGTYTCGDPKEFLKYVTRTRDDTVIFLSPDSIKAIAVIDYGVERAPGWGDHTAVCTPEKTAQYAMLSKLCARPQSQQNMLEAIEDYGNLWVFSSTVDGHPEPMDADAAYGLFRDVTAENVRGLRATKSDYKTERTTMERITVNTPLPTHIRYGGECFSGLLEEHRSFRITASNDGGSVSFSLREIARTMNDDLSRRVFQEILLAGLGKNTDIGIHVGNWHNEQSMAVISHE